MSSKSKKPAQTPSLQPEGELFRLAVEAAPNGMLMVGGDGKILLVNSHIETIFGYKREELLGKTMELLVPPRFRAAHVGHRDGFFSHPSTRAMGAGRDLFGLRKDGTEVPVEIGLNPMVTPEGRFVLASIVDISERRALEKRLAHTEILAAVGGMVAVVAHEIRNPLGSIVMAAKALARGGLSEEDHRQVMSALVGESERLNRTLADFLQYSRPREPKFARGDLKATVREVIAAIKSDRGALGKVKVEESLAQDLPALRFDADQLRQVLWNLIRNALQALEGKGRLKIIAEVRPREIAIHVEDNGPGIAPEQLKKLFVPFQTTKAKGTGLGLSISRNIVVAHGGDIEVQTEPGRGCRFSIILPIPK